MTKTKLKKQIDAALKKEGLGNWKLAENQIFSSMLIDWTKLEDNKEEKFLSRAPEAVQKIVRPHMVRHYDELLNAVNADQSETAQTETGIQEGVALA